jgi:hypothetical protein
MAERTIGIRYWVGVVTVAATIAGCQPVPTGPEEGSTGTEPRDRTYTNADWGFSISPFDSFWSVSASQIFGFRETNGLSPVQVIMRRSNPGQAFQPSLLLNSFGRPEGEALDGTAALFEAQYMRDFENYNQLGEKVSGTVGGVASIEWTFRAREPQTGVHFMNNRFLSVVFLRDDQVYQILCSGQQDDFPESNFRTILGSFQFGRP